MTVVGVAAADAIVVAIGVVVARTDQPHPGQLWR